MKKQIETSEDLMSIMTFKIDRSWTAEEFQTFFDSLNKIYEYNKILSSYMISYETFGKEFSYAKGLENLPMFHEIKNGLLFEAKNVFGGTSYDNNFYFHIMPHRHFGLLEVVRIQYASPGGIDLLGIGKFFEIIKDLLVHYLPNKEKKLDSVLKAKEIEEKEQKILQDKIENLKRLGLTPTEIMSLVGLESFHVQNILKLQSRGQITGIEITKDGKKHSA